MSNVKCEAWKLISRLVASFLTALKQRLQDVRVYFKLSKSKHIILFMDYALMQDADASPDLRLGSAAMFSNSTIVQHLYYSPIEFPLSVILIYCHSDALSFRRRRNLHHSIHADNSIKTLSSSRNIPNWDVPKSKGAFQFFAWDWNPTQEYVIEPMALERGTTRAIGSVAYCSDGFQSVAYFRLRKSEMHPKSNRAYGSVKLIVALKTQIPQTPR
jgi:hypothetical protein